MTYKKYKCTICGVIYDERLGMVSEGIPPGTLWKDIPNDWMCPDCGVSKASFNMEEIK